MAQYGVVALLSVTFLPAVLKIAVQVALKPLFDSSASIAISVFLVAEAVILAALIYLLGSREAPFRWSTVIPYQKSVHPFVFIVLLAAVTAYAIYFRDFFRWMPLMDWAGFVRETVTFWPPEWLRLRFQFDQPDAAASTRIGLLAFGMIAIGTASAMQTLYFRGFVLPRMEYLGWAAPFANTVLFVVFHTNSPEFWHLFFIFTLGWGIVVYATRNVWIAVTSHVIFNTYSFGPAIFELAAAE